MGLMEWTLVIIVGMVFVLLCYSFFSTAIEIGKRGQPFVDHVFDAVHFLVRYKRPNQTGETNSGKSKPN